MEINFNQIKPVIILITYLISIGGLNSGLAQQAFLHEEQIESERVAANHSEQKQIVSKPVAGSTHALGKDYAEITDVNNKKVIKNENKATAAKTNTDVQLMLQQGNVEAVIGVLEKTEYQNRSWKTYFWLGTAYLLNKQLNKAAGALDSALALQSDIAEIWVQRATIEQERNNAAAAVQLLQLAIQINPKNAKAYLNLAYAYEVLKKPRKARAAYGYYLKFADGKSVQDIRLKQKVLSNLVKKAS